MGKKAELADGRVEEAAPLLIVRVDDIKNHRHMGLDVHHHEGSGWWRLGTGWWWGRRSAIERGGEGRGRGGGRAMGGVLEREQWVVVHGEQRR